MRIERLRLKDFRRHESLDIEPAAGLTVLRGPNESGKSTIQQALESVLFVNAESAAQATRDLHRWGATGSPVVALEFEADGSKGRLIKTFGGSKGSAELIIGDEVIRDPTAIAERVHTLSGIPNKAFFRSTASVGHAELTDVAGDEPLMQDRLQKAISGADRGTAAAKKKLAAAIQRYRSEGSVNPGRLKVVREELAHLEGELANGEAELEALEADRSAWAEAHERRAGLDEQLQREEAELADAMRAQTMVSRRDEMQARYEHAKRAAELVGRENELRQRAPTPIPLENLRNGVARASSLSLDISELEAELSVGAEGPSADGQGRGPRPWPWVAMAFVAALAAGLAWFLLDGLVAVVALVILAAVTIILLVQSVRVALRARQFVLARSLARSATVDRQEADRGRQDAFYRRSRELEQEFNGLGVADLAQATALLAAAEAHDKEMARVDGELRGLGIAERDQPRLEADRDEAANGADQARHALAAMGDVAQDPGTAVRRLEAQAERTRPARDSARSDEDQALGRVNANGVDAENVAVLVERLASARERQAGLQRSFLVYQATLDAIEEAEKATLKTAARYLEEHMGPAISRITDGRYHEIKVNEADLAFTVRSPESGEFEEAEMLSRGTADQLYLVARLGLVRLVTLDRRPPLVLDDPFVTFDAPRARRAITILREVAAEQGVQILFLTWSDRYDLEADKVIELEAPAPAAAPAPVVAPGSAGGPGGSSGVDGGSGAPA